MEIGTAVATAIVQQFNVANAPPPIESIPAYSRRRYGKVDRLKPYLRTIVEQMLIQRCPYREIVEFLEDNGETMSAMAICTYAKKFFTSLEMMNENSLRWEYEGYYRGN